jgi:protein SCO1
MTVNHGECVFMKRVFQFAACLVLTAGSAWAAQQYPVAGMVLNVDQPHKKFVVSCQSIPGYMDAMVMPFAVRDGGDLAGVAPGMTVDFTLAIEKQSNYAEHIHIRHYESVEQDPLTARRLKLLNQLSHPTIASALDVGQTVPDFVLTDQNRHPVALSQFSGKVVAINFIYTSCALPNFCFRNTNTFGVLQKRFTDKMGRDLVLLTVTFDPQRDGPEALANYAKTWKANPAIWHFLTGSVPDIQHVSNLFGVDYFPDEGLMNHSLHTAIINSQGRLVANIEGNQFTAEQLGDLVQTVLNQRSGPEIRRQARLKPVEGTSVSAAR